MQKILEYREYVLYAGYFLVFVATFIFMRMILTEQENLSTQENLRDLDGKRTANPLVRVTRPFFTQYILPSIRGKSRFDQMRTNYRRKVISAGLKDQLTADEFIAFKIFLVVFFPLAAGFWNATNPLLGKMMADLQLLEPGDLPLIPGMIIPALPLVGYLYPDMWVNGLIKERHKSVIKSLPFVVDLLALSTEAGLDFIGALQKVVDKAAPGPLVDELEQALKEIKVGSSRAEALRELAFRINLQEVNSFIAVLVSADQMGASIGKVLRQQSDQIRSLRFVMAEKAGAVAAQKLMFPTFALILPAILLMMIGPFYLSGGMD
jgi:tight adherence protein C